MLKYILPIFLLGCDVTYVPEPTPTEIPGAPNVPVLTNPYVYCEEDLEGEYWIFSVVVWDEDTVAADVGIYNETYALVESYALQNEDQVWRTTVRNSIYLDCRYPAMYGYHFTALDSEGNSNFVNATIVYTGN